jgi:hypothetical protein
MKRFKANVAVVSVFGGLWFEFGPWDQLSWLRLFVVFFIRSKQVPGWLIKIGDDEFVSRSSFATIVPCWETWNYPRISWRLSQSPSLLSPFGGATCLPPVCPSVPLCPIRAAQPRLEHKDCSSICCGVVLTTVGVMYGYIRDSGY